MTDWRGSSPGHFAECGELLLFVETIRLGLNEDLSLFEHLWACKKMCVFFVNHSNFPWTLIAQFFPTLIGKPSANTILLVWRELELVHERVERADVATGLWLGWGVKHLWRLGHCEVNGVRQRLWLDAQVSFHPHKNSLVLLRSEAWHELEAILELGRRAWIDFSPSYEETVATKLPPWNSLGAIASDPTFSFSFRLFSSLRKMSYLKWLPFPTAVCSTGHQPTPWNWVELSPCWGAGSLTLNHPQELEGCEGLIFSPLFSLLECMAPKPEGLGEGNLDGVGHPGVTIL